MSVTDKLTAIGENVSKVYEAGRRAEYNRFWESFQMNGERTSYIYGFAGDGWNKDTFYPKYDIIPNDNINQIFYQFGLNSQAGGTNTLNLVERAKECGITIRFNKVAFANYAFYYAKISHLPTVNITAYSGANVGSIFQDARYTKSIEKVIVSEKLKYQSVAFQNMLALEEIRFEGVIGNTIAIAESTKLSKDSIISIVEALSETATEQTLSLSKKAVNNAFGIDVDDESTYPVGSEYYTLRHSKDNWTFSYV